jgi:acetate kinase
MREIGARATGGDDAARLAIEVFSYRVKKYVGAYLAVLGGRCDALAFTGGIGEHSAVVRATVCDGLDGLGLVLDPARNERGDEVVSADGSPIAVLVIATDEELEIARQTARILGG